jgi:hypothetical protein
MQIFGKKWDQVRDKFITLHNEELTDLYRSASWPVVRPVKYRRLVQAGYVDRLGRRDMCSESWWRNRFKNGQVEDLSGDWGIKIR